MAQFRLLVVVIVFIVGIGVFVLSAAAHEGESPFPAPTGPYGVGVTARYWIDEAREEIYTPDNADDKRELMVHFWYPADVPADSEPEVYLPDRAVELLGLLDAFKTVLGMDQEMPQEIMEGVSTHSFRDAALAPTQTPYPVLVFSHGWGGVPGIYTAQLEELASYGYIIAGINHTYGSSATVFPDGRVVMPNFDRYADLVAKDWSEDQVYVLDQLEAMQAGNPEDVFTGKLDLQQVGIFGMSMGGAATAKTCLVDNRCKAAINEDGGFTPDVVQDGLTMPYLLMRNGDDGTGSQDRLVARHSVGTNYMLTFAGFGHNTVTDLPLWSVEMPFVGSIDGVRSVEITRAYLLAFFDHYLKGEAAPLLDGASADYPEVEFQVANP